MLQRQPTKKKPAIQSSKCVRGRWACAPSLLDLCWIQSCARLPALPLPSRLSPSRLTITWIGRDLCTTMGRFRLVSLHDDSDDEVEEEEEQPAPQHWEFVGEPGEEGALVVREEDDPTTTAPSTEDEDETRTAPAAAKESTRFGEGYDHRSIDDHHRTMSGRRMCRVRTTTAMIINAGNGSIPAPSSVFSDNDHDHPCGGNGSGSCHSPCS